MFAYNNPVASNGDGRVKTDPINQQRIQKVLNNFEQWSNNKNLTYSNDLPINLGQVSKAQKLFPLVGLTVGVLGSATFVHKNSNYIGKFFTLGMIGVGYWFGRRYQQSYNSFKYFWNFPNYPKDIQKMIDNNDARYAHRWLKQDFLNIEA